jgi:hypothetical protein
MKLGKIVLKLRLANTTFENMIGGAVELTAAINNTLTKEMAFVIPLIDDARVNEYDNFINQAITERFGVVVALRNDLDFADKLGIAAYDRLHDIRNEIFSAILGWQIAEAETITYYRGGKLVGFNSAYLYYQFEFEYQSRVISDKGDRRKISLVVNDNIDEQETEETQLFEKIYAWTILSPSERLNTPIDLPLTDIFPDLGQAIDMQSDPGAGGLNKSFSTGFNIYDSAFTR